MDDKLTINCCILGTNEDGKKIFLKEIWPTRSEIQEVEKNHVLPAMFKDTYSRIEKGSLSWQNIDAPNSQLYPWDPNSTYIKNPPFFENMTKVNSYSFTNINKYEYTFHRIFYRNYQE